MNATCVPQPVPTPPDMILLEMSEEEAQILYRVCNEYPMNMPVDIRYAIVRALSAAWVRW